MVAKTLTVSGNSSIHQDLDLPDIWSVFGRSRFPSERQSEEDRAGASRPSFSTSISFCKEASKTRSVWRQAPRLVGVSACQCGTKWIEYPPLRNEDGSAINSVKEHGSHGALCSIKERSSTELYALNYRLSTIVSPLTTRIFASLGDC